MTPRIPALMLLALWAAAVHAQPAGPLAPPGAAASRFPKPDRPVAEIVSPRWAQESLRSKADEVGQVAQLMEIKSGETVADIGAGDGYYVFKLAKIVGPSGRVIAEDITPTYLDDLARKIDASKAPNIMLVRGEAHDPRLPAASLDAAVLVHMYHEIADPYALLHNLAPAMKPGGRVGIVDADDIPSKHGTPPRLLACELAAAGYTQKSRTVLKGGVGYLAIFEAPAAQARPEPETITPCRDEATRGRR